MALPPTAPVIPVGNPQASSTAFPSHGYQQSVNAGSPVPLVSSSVACSQVTIQCSYSSTDLLLVGDASGQVLELNPGDNETIEVNDISKIYVVAQNTTAIYNWWARN